MNGKLAAAAAAAAALFALALAWRPLSSLDLGYHLAYGDELWARGRVVGDATFIAPAPTPAEAAGGPGSVAAPIDLPPGARFAADGRYTFPNANWASQALMSLVHRAAGATGLVLLAVAAVAAILCLQAWTVRGATGTWAWTGPVWLASALTAYERFALRPELFGLVCLVAQLALLMRPLTLRRAGAWLTLQVAAVNVHSYWPLGVVVLAAAAVDAWVAARATRHAAAAARHGRRDVARVAPTRRLVPVLALGAAALACGALHPAGGRNATLPFSTLAYMRQHHIGGTTPAELRQLAQQGRSHPWQDTGELVRTFAAGVPGSRATRCFAVLALLAVPAAFVLARRRRPGLAFVAVAFVMLALPVRRNLATAGFVVWPLVAIAAAWALARQPRRAQAWARAALGATAIAALVLLQGVAGGRFYRDEQRDTRFGAGWSRAVLPLQTCAWLDAHLDRPQPVFANFNASSSVLYFSRRVSHVPILTNGWAVPPQRKARLQRMQAGQEWIDPFARDNHMDVAVFYALPSIRPLLSRLAAANDWSLVHIEGAYVVFARHTPSNATLVAGAIRRETLDVAGLARRAYGLDPEGGRGLLATAGALTALGWDEHARSLLGSGRPQSARR